MYGAITLEEGASLVGGNLLKGAGYAALPVLMYDAVKSAHQEKEMNKRLAEDARKNGNKGAAWLFERRPTRCEILGSA